MSAILAAFVSCEGLGGKVTEDDIYNASGNESFVEYPLVNDPTVDDNITRIWTTPANPDADGPVTISFRAGKGSPLRGYTGDVYAHIGLLEFGTWKFVQAEWTENKDKCKFTADPSVTNTWHLEIGPTVREYFESGTTPVTEIGIVIRSADSSIKGIAEDRFITVTDKLYKGFEPAAYVNQPMPSGCRYGINVNGTSITFVLHDQDTRGEHKDYAYIMGDFNDWTLTNDDRSQMYRDDANGCWWITVNGLDPDKEYRYQYHVGEKVDGESDKVVRLSDAFSEKILDPNNDKWINYNHPVYPAEQLEYPGDKGASGMVSCVKINRDNFDWVPFTMKNQECPVIYEMLLGDFTSTNDLAGAIQKLDYLQTLGVNAVELMPIQEFDGNESWGYNPNHYFAVDKAYGTREQYKTFINECHKRGIAVIIDVVYNHSTGDSPLAKIYWNSSKNQTAANNPYFFETARHDFNVFHDINHGNKFMQDLIKRSLVYLTEEYNVDGFRFDLSKGFTDSSAGWNGTDNTRIALIKDYAKAIRSAKADSYIILEHWGNSTEENQYVRDGMHPWKKLNYEFCETAMGWGGVNLGGAHAWLDSTWGASGWVTFMESHDEERMAYKQDKYGHASLKGILATSMENLAMNAVCFLGMPGPKMIWQMGELGYNYNKWCKPDGTDMTGTGEYETSRKPVKWDYLDVPERKALYDVYCKMNDLRLDNPDLFGKTANYRGSMSAWSVKDFEVSYGSKQLVGFVNFHGNASAAKSVTIPSGTWTDILTGKTVQGGSYNLNTGEALVLVNSAVVR